MTKNVIPYPSKKKETQTGGNGGGGAKGKSELAKRLTREFVARGMSQTAFGEFLGDFKQQQVRKWLSGEARPISGWRQIANALGWPLMEMARLMDLASVDLVRAKSFVEELVDEGYVEDAYPSQQLVLAGPTPLLLPAPTVSAPLPYRRGVKPMPIYGYAAGSPDGRLIMDGGAADWVACPAELEDVPAAYGVYVRGDSMRERYRDGMRLNINPDSAYHAGDGVVVQVRDAEGGYWFGYVKEYVAQTEAELVVRQYNPPGEMRFPLASVMYVHRVVGTVEV
jgi:phage repressor protein C with HTH and peptisase S24 domain